MSEELWRLGQRTRLLRELLGDIQSIWDDTAAYEINRRYLTPQQDGDDAMQQALHEQKTALQYAAQIYEAAEEKIHDVEKLHQRVVDSLQIVNDNMKESQQHYETALNFNQESQAFFAQITAAIQKANNACSGIAADPKGTPVTVSEDRVAVRPAQSRPALAGNSSSSAPSSTKEHKQAATGNGAKTDKSVAGSTSGKSALSIPSTMRIINKRYAGALFTVEDSRYPEGVKFDLDGFPIFTPYCKTAVKIDMIGDHYQDYINANIAAGFGDTYKPPEGFTWHHHQDRTTMELVPKGLHKLVRHTGGVEMINQMGRLK